MSENLQTSRGQRLLRWITEVFTQGAADAEIAAELTRERVAGENLPVDPDSAAAALVVDLMHTTRSSVAQLPEGDPAGGVKKEQLRLEDQTKEDTFASLERELVRQILNNEFTPLQKIQRILMGMPTPEVPEESEGREEPDLLEKRIDVLHGTPFGQIQWVLLAQIFCASHDPRHQEIVTRLGDFIYDLKDDPGAIEFFNRIMKGNERIDTPNRAIRAIEIYDEAMAEIVECDAGLGGE